MAKVTLKDIKNLYNEYNNHEQVDSKQLFICSNRRSEAGLGFDKILVSYRTIVGYYDAVLCTWVLTKQRYSVTTTRQLTQFARGRDVTWIDSL